MGQRDSGKKSKKGKGKRGKVEEIKPVAFHWKALGGLATLSALGLIISVALPMWRRTDAVTYPHRNPGGLGSSGSFVTYTYGPSTYGLLTAVFNNGARTMPWQTLSTRVCSAAALAASNVVADYIELACNAACVSHFTSRCTAYKALTNQGFIVMSFLIVSAIVALIGVGWLFMMGQNSTFLKLCWLGMALLDMGIYLYWLIDTDTQFNTLNAEGFFPYPSVYIGAWLAVSCMSTLGFCGICVWLLGAYDERQEWAAKRKAIEDTLIYNGDGDDPSAAFGPYPGGAGFGGVGSPPGAAGRPGGPPVGFSNLGQQQRAVAALASGAPPFLAGPGAAHGGPGPGGFPGQYGGMRGPAPGNPFGGGQAPAPPYPMAAAGMAQQPWGGARNAPLASAARNAAGWRGGPPGGPGAGFGGTPPAGGYNNMYPR